MGGRPRVWPVAIIGRHKDYHGCLRQAHHPQGPGRGMYSLAVQDHKKHGWLTWFVMPSQMAGSPNQFREDSRTPGDGVHQQAALGDRPGGCAPLAGEPRRGSHVAWADRRIGGGKRNRFGWMFAVETAGV